jgi:hypothetical protein
MKKSFLLLLIPILAGAIYLIFKNLKTEGASSVSGSWLTQPQANLNTRYDTGNTAGSLSQPPLMMEDTSPVKSSLIKGINLSVNPLNNIYL